MGAQTMLCNCKKTRRLGNMPLILGHFYRSALNALERDHHYSHHLDSSNIDAQVSMPRTDHITPDVITECHVDI